MNGRVFRRAGCAAIVMAMASVVGLFGQVNLDPRSEVIVEVTRGELVESCHYGRIVAIAPSGELAWAVGNPHSLIYPRSALKPIQALATVMMAQEQGADLATDVIAIMCASHEGEDYHQAAVSKLLARAGASERELYCGAVRGSRLCHNCSGKHSGMLLQARIAGNPADGYWRVDHPVQMRIQTAIQEFTDYHEPLIWAPDGCGVPNYALPMDRLALGYARLANPDRAPEKYRRAADAIRRAMQAHPELISSKNSFDAALIESAGGNLIGKTGAEACYGLGLSEPALGIVVKIEDGSTRGMNCVLLSELERARALTDVMDQAVGDKRITPITNSVGQVVGEIRSRSR